MLLVEGRLRKTGKDVMLHILSFCSWSWFEVLAEDGDGAGSEGIGARVKRRKLK